MTKFGQGGTRGEEHEPTRITVKDKRRIDPTTGAVRDLPQPDSAAGNPGDPANATPPKSVSEPAAGAQGAAASSPADSESTDPGSSELEAARQEAAERTADLQRITAEYANYRKRADRDKQAAAVAGKATVVGELLAVLDDLDRAEEHGDLTGGFKTVADKLTETLARVGLSHFGADGDEFDPNIHEAVQFATAADVDHPTVTTVLRRGYLFEERVLRPAVVVVTGPEHGSAVEGDLVDGGDSAAGDSAGEGARSGGGDGAADDVAAGDVE